MEARKKTNITIGISSIILICTITLFLLGYSSALAIESVFGIPAKLTYSSTLELLHLSSLVFSGWLEIINSETFIDSIKSLTIKTLIIGTTISVVILTANKIHTKTKENKIHKEKKYKNNFFEKTIRWIEKEKLNLIPIAIGAVLPGAILLIITIIIISFTIVPVMGFSAAKQNLQSWLIEPDYCAPLINRENRVFNKGKTNKKPNEKSKKITPCLSIWKNEKLLAEGRYITSIGTHIAIFNPKNGEVLIEPIDGASIRVSGEEEINQRENKKINE